jgi:hypothetical protein
VLIWEYIDMKPAFLKGKKGPAEKTESKKEEKTEAKMTPGARKKVEAKEAAGFSAFKKGGPVKSKKC